MHCARRGVQSVCALHLAQNVPISRNLPQDERLRSAESKAEAAKARAAAAERQVREGREAAARAREGREEATAKARAEAASVAEASRPEAAMALGGHSHSGKEAEEILVECHGLCDPNGLIFNGLYDASGSPEQCTVDCAAARLHGESFSGKSPESLAPPSRNTALAQTKKHASGAGLEQGDVSQAAQVLLKCHAECGASSDDSSTCTMACAQRHLKASGASVGPRTANLTAAPRLVSGSKAEASRPKAVSPPKGELAEDEDERDIIFKSGRH